MDAFTQRYVEGFMADVMAKNPGEKEFHQAVREVVESVAPYVTRYPHLMDQKILERIVEPERVKAAISGFIRKHLPAETVRN